MREPKFEQTMAVAERLLGRKPERIERLRGGVFTLTTADGSRILKWSREAEAYRLLARLGVPTLRMFASCADALLVEDLATSAQWGAATAEDVLLPEVGAAVADWYRQLHAAGLHLAASERPAFLKRETDAITPANLDAAARRLGLEALVVWRPVAEHVEALKARYEALPTTLLYNDFHWSNLALSRAAPVRAVVFDYHLLGIGPAVSDYRNILTALGPAAGAAFRERYGPMDEGALALDAPLALLYSLVEASRRDTVPCWAEHVVERVRSGELEHLVHHAVGP